MTQQKEKTGQTADVILSSAFCKSYNLNALEKAMEDAGLDFTLTVVLPTRHGKRTDVQTLSSLFPVQPGTLQVIGARNETYSPAVRIHHPTRSHGEQFYVYGKSSIPHIVRSLTLGQS